MGRMKKYTIRYKIDAYVDIVEYALSEDEADEKASETFDKMSAEDYEINDAISQGAIEVEETDWEVDYDEEDHYYDANDDL